jgi:hypothetical protein
MMSYSNLRVWRKDESDAPTGTVLREAGAGFVDVEWDDGSTSFIPLSELRTYGQHKNGYRMI